MAATAGAVGRIGAMPNAQPRTQCRAAIQSVAGAGAPTEPRARPAHVKTPTPATMRLVCPSNDQRRPRRGTTFDTRRA